jgi:hypothetical protein
MRSRANVEELFGRYIARFHPAWILHAALLEDIEQEILNRSCRGGFDLGALRLATCDAGLPGGASDACHEYDKYQARSGQR